MITTEKMQAEVFCEKMEESDQFLKVIPEEISIIDSDNFLSPRWLEFTDGSEAKLTEAGWTPVAEAFIIDAQ